MLRLRLFDTLRLERPRAILKKMEREEKVGGRGVGGVVRSKKTADRRCMVDHLRRVRLLLHLEEERSEWGSLAKEYIFRVLLCQDLLMDKVSEKEKTQRARVINKMVGHAPGAENALHIYQTWN